MKCLLNGLLTECVNISASAYYNSKNINLCIIVENSRNDYNKSRPYIFTNICYIIKQNMLKCHLISANLKTALLDQWYICTKCSNVKLKNTQVYIHE